MEKNGTIMKGTGRLGKDSDDQERNGILIIFCFLCTGLQNNDYLCEPLVDVDIIRRKGMGQQGNAEQLCDVPLLDCKLYLPMTNANISAREYDKRERKYTQERGTYVVGAWNMA